VSRSEAEWTQADCPSSNQTAPRPATSGTVPCVPKRSGVDTGGPSLLEPNHPRPATSGTVPCVPKRSGVDTGGLSLLDSNRPPTSNVRDCPLCPEAQRSGHRRTVPPRLKPPPDHQRPGLSPVSRSEAERTQADCPSSTQTATRPGTTDQGPPTSNVRDCPLCPEAQRSGHRRTVPPRTKPPPNQQRLGLSPVSRSAAEWTLADCPSSTQTAPRLPAKHHRPATSSAARAPLTG